MKIAELVPDIELCKLIPWGEFRDSIFVHNIDDIGTYILWTREDRILSEGWHIYPAPTLQETMEKLPSCVCYRMNEEWSVGLVNDSAENAIKDSSGATAALKLWLKLKRIDVQKTEKFEQ